MAFGSISVPAVGPKICKIAIVGEAPGSEEEKMLQPFVGPSGRILNENLHRVGLSRSLCYITNISKFSIPGNDFKAAFWKGKQPNASLIASKEALLKELDEIQTNVIVALGGNPLWALTGHSAIGKWRGSILLVKLPSGREVKVIGSYHPAAIIRNFKFNPIQRFDLRKAIIESDFPDRRLPVRNLIIEPTFDDIVRFFDQNRGEYAFDIETSPHSLNCISFAFSRYEAMSIPTTKGYWGSWANLKLVLQVISKVLNRDCVKIGQNMSYDIQWIMRAWNMLPCNTSLGDFDGPKIQWWDTMIAQHCLTGNQKVDTLHGKFPIKDLVNRNDIWIWSWKDNKPFPRKAKYIRKTRKDTEIVRVHIWRRIFPGIEKTYIDCTPDHKFLVDNNWIEAKNLKCGASLTRVKVHYSKTRNYLRINSIDIPISRYVWESLNGPIPNKHIIHHLNGNIQDDRPENLEIYHDSKHKSLHIDEYRLANYVKKNGPWNSKLKRAFNPDIEDMIEMYNGGMTELDIATHYGVSRSTIQQRLNKSGVKKRGRSIASSLALSNKKNCKVLNVEWLKETQDTYCMEIEGTHALSINGIIVHNSCYSELPKGLDFLASVYTNELYYKDDLKMWLKGESDNKQYWTYNARDSAVTFEVKEKLDIEMKELDVKHTFDYMMKLLEPILFMSMSGLRIDKDKLQYHIDSYTKSLKEREARFSAKFGGVNPHSPQQVMKLAYETLKLKPITKKGKQTSDKAALEKLSIQSPEIAEVIGIRGDRKLLSTYMTDLIDPISGRFMFSINPTGAETFRLSSSSSVFGFGTNSQNFPKKIRDMLIPDEGMEFTEIDLKGAESMIVAYWSGDLASIRIFEEGKNIHTFTACLIFNITPEQVKEDKEKRAKDGTDTKSYYFRAKKLRHTLEKKGSFIEIQKQLKIPAAEAKQLQRKFYDLNPNLEKLFRTIDAELKRTKIIVTATGRKRIFFGRLGPDLVKEAVAYEPQEVVGCVINHGIIRFYYEVCKIHKDISVKLQVHDSLLVQHRPDQRQFVVEKLQELMIYILTYHGRTFHIPLEFQHGNNWRDMN